MSKTSKKAVVNKFSAILRNKSLADFGTRSMTIYADEVNLGRAVPDLIDGLKPVQRRIMWAMSTLGGDFVKTARVVGETLGRYHPHGDMSVEGAIVTIVQSNTPTISGKGGWGNLIDRASASRYTNCALSNYGKTFFQPNYITREVTHFVPNYDGTTTEPVSLPALLPNVLLNGGEGIGVGKGNTTCLPNFTAESTIEMMLRLLKGDKLTVDDFAKTMKFQTRWGGHLVKNKHNKEAWRQLFTSNSASLEFESELVIDRDHKAIEIDDWSPGIDPVKFVDKVRLMPGCKRVFNNKGATGFRIEADKGINYQQFDSFVEKVQKATRIRRSFKINVTHRQCAIDDGVVSFKTDYMALSVPQLLVAWLRERLKLEVRSLTFRVAKQEKAIRYSELLIFASTKLDVIFKALRQPDSKAYLMKHLGLSAEQANQILDLKVRQLSALDTGEMKKKLRDQQAELKVLQTYLAKPKRKVYDDTEAILESIRKDRKFEEAKSRKMTVK